jgi:hypothetical protein
MAARMAFVPVDMMQVRAVAKGPSPADTATVREEGKEVCPVDTAKNSAAAG